MRWGGKEGRRLREQRKRQRFTQEALADATDVTRTWVGLVERGRPPSSGLLKQFAKVLQVCVRTLAPLVPRARRRLRSPIPIPTLTATAARAGLERLDAEEAALKREDSTLFDEVLRQGLFSLRTPRQRTPSFLIFKREGSISAEEIARRAELEEREQRLGRERRGYVLALVRTDKAAVFSDPAVRHCYEDAVRLGDLKFIEAFGVAVATLPDRRVRDLDAALENVRFIEEDDHLGPEAAVDRYVEEVTTSQDLTTGHAATAPVAEKKKLRRRLRRALRRAG